MRLSWQSLGFPACPSNQSSCGRWREREIECRRHGKWNIRKQIDTLITFSSWMLDVGCSWRVFRLLWPKMLKMSSCCRFCPFYCCSAFHWHAAIFLHFGFRVQRPTEERRTKGQGRGTFRWMGCLANNLAVSFNALQLLMMGHLSRKCS